MDQRALIEQIFERIINQGDLAAVDELFCEDYVDHGPMGDTVGREEFNALVAGWRQAVPDVHCTLENVFFDGDFGAWLVRTVGTHTGDGLGFPATGKRFETLSANVGRTRDGRAAEHWSEQGMLSMLGQLGVLPMPSAS